MDLRTHGAMAEAEKIKSRVVMSYGAIKSYANGRLTRASEHEKRDENKTSKTGKLATSTFISMFSDKYSEIRQCDSQ